MYYSYSYPYYFMEIYNFHYHFPHGLVYFYITTIFTEAFWVIKTIVGKDIISLTDTFPGVSKFFL